MNPSMSSQVDLDLTSSGSNDREGVEFSAACGLLLAAVGFGKTSSQDGDSLRSEAGVIILSTRLRLLYRLIARWVEPFDHPRPRWVK